MTRTGVAFMAAVLWLGYAAVVLFVDSFESFFTLTILLLTVLGALIAGFREYGVWRTTKGVVVVSAVLAAAWWMTDTIGWWAGWIPIVIALSFSRSGPTATP